MSSLYRRKDSLYWYYSFGAGRNRIYRSTGTTSKRIAKLLQDKWDEMYILQKHGIRKATLSHLIREYLKIINTRKNYSWARRIRQHLTNFREFTPDKPVEEFQTADIDQFVSHRLSNDIANKTIRDEVRSISACFDYAITHGYAGTNPCKAAILPDNRAKSPRIDIPIDIIEKALENAPRADDKIFWTVIAYTGLRSGDAGTLKPDNFSNGLITVRPEKTSRWQTIAQIPIHPKLTAIGIDNLINVMPTRGRRNAFLQRFKEVVKQAGYTSRADLHSLRHSFSTRLANAGLSPDMIRLVTGHTTTNQTLKYIHPSMEMIRKSMEQF